LHGIEFSVRSLQKKKRNSKINPPSLSAFSFSLFLHLTIPLQLPSLSILHVACSCRMTREQTENTWIGPREPTPPQTEGRKCNAKSKEQQKVLLKKKSAF